MIPRRFKATNILPIVYMLLILLVCFQLRNSFAETQMDKNTYFSVSEPEYQIGVLTSGATSSFVLTMRNHSNHDIDIDKIAVPCGCIKVKYENKIPAKGSLPLSVAFDSTGKIGAQELTIRILLKGSEPRLYNVKLTAFVIPNLIRINNYEKTDKIVIEKIIKWNEQITLSIVDFSTHTEYFNVGANVREIAQGAYALKLWIKPRKPVPMQRFHEKCDVPVKVGEKEQIFSFILEGSGEQSIRAQPKTVAFYISKGQANTKKTTVTLCADPVVLEHLNVNISEGCEDNGFKVISASLGPIQFNKKRVLSIHVEDPAKITKQYLKGLIAIENEDDPNERTTIPVEIFKF